MDYEALYKKLAQAIVKAEGKMNADTAAFVARFVKQLRAQGYKLDGDAEAALNTYLTSMETTLKSAISEALVISSGVAVTQASLHSKTVLAAAEQAFIAQWPDGLALSDRLWRWKKSARDGVQQQLQLGIKQAKANGAVVYNLQRAIEKDTGRRFAIVSDHTSQWVQELYESAQTMIHTPLDKTAWQKVVDEVESHISDLSRTGNRHAAERLLSQIKLAVNNGEEALLDSAVKWWTYDQQLYHLRRIARTEMATAAHRAVIDTSIDDPDIIGFQWRLSGSHPIYDICDYYASIEMGLGKGVFSKEAVPRHKAHPHCMCLLIPRTTPIKQRGDKNYAEFIQNTSKARRDVMLPEWAKQAVDDGVPLAALVRSDGFGLVSKKDAAKIIHLNAVEKVLATLTEKAKNAASGVGA